jgi:hypothetical protein
MPKSRCNWWLARCGHDQPRRRSWESSSGSCHRRLTRAAIAVVCLTLLRADSYAFDQSHGSRDDEIREVVIRPSFRLVAMHGDIASRDMSARVNAGVADEARLTNAGDSATLELRSYKWA